ncbi:hypothetical protein FHS31_000845 [Sphingomonas vulcanisoli]|uniref:Putative tail fiber protein gp53-like C-terminal domain-containing protein n=1 Tax=Sphingomonas vulcanisoli TaxID=1658060 RepID=A0ABX0TSY3_9SPHN|nr:hypothetical protein [Sphingomonas vulcanisoli]NIJ07249.1 hypothetical protein [Sphingomonas vulcanisoli]
MYQIDVPSAAGSLPAPAAAGTSGYFTDGDPVGGQQGTIVPADFLNSVMMELIAVVIAGGGTPSKTIRTQVRDAILNLILESVTGNLAANGHIKIPIGTQSLTINWGNGTHADSSGNQAVTFDQAFTSAHLCSLATNRSNGVPTVSHATGNYSTTGMTIHSAVLSTGAAAGSGTTFNYIAIGL